MFATLFLSLLTLSVLAEHHIFYWTVTLGSDAPDCVVRDVIKVNGNLVGPEIRVTQGDDITVHVFNLVPAIEVTFHWHGIEQNDPWMDGHEQNSCPIHYGQNFTYTLHIAEDHYPGTYWYHFNNQGLRSNGGYGAFIVDPSWRSARPEPQELSLAASEKTLLIHDWYHLNFVGFNALSAAFSTEEYWGETLIFNGKGRWDCTSYLVDGDPKYCRDWTTGACGELERVRGNENDVIRLRLVNAGFHSVFGITIDKHDMTVLQADGFPVESYTVSTLFLSPGQRYDVVITLDQEPDVYWIGGGTVNQPDVGNDADYMRGFAILEYGDQGRAKEPLDERREVVTETTDDMVTDMEWERVVEQNKALKPHAIVDESPPTVEEVSIRIHLQFVEAKAMWDPVDWAFVAGSFDEESREYQQAKQTLASSYDDIREDLDYLYGLDEHLRYNDDFIAPMILARNNNADWGVSSIGYPSQLNIITGVYETYNQSTEVELDAVVEIVLESASHSFKPNRGCVPHSYHLYGYKPWVVAMGEGPFPAENPPDDENVIRRDTFTVISSSPYVDVDAVNATTMVGQMGKMCNWGVIRFRASKPGVFPLYGFLGTHSVQRQRWDLIVGKEEIPPPPAGVEICGSTFEETEECPVLEGEDQSAIRVFIGMVCVLVLMNIAVLRVLCSGCGVKKKQDFSRV